MPLSYANLQRLVAIVLTVIVALSAQAWASHVDWPAFDGETYSHVESTAVDNADTGVSADHNDHCSHASAHLVGIQSDAPDMGLRGMSSRNGRHRDLYRSLAHTPLIDPPIA
jgi:hypothetical protein